MKTKIVTLAAIAAVLSLLPSCRHGRTGPVGPQGEQGQPGNPGIDGIDGLNGISFDYVRGMDGATVCNRVLITNAANILPPNILAFAPEEDPYDPDGLTLTFGTESLAFRIYLGEIRAGEYCVVEKEWGQGWQGVESDNNPLAFLEDGYVAVVPEATLSLFDTSFQAELLMNGVWVEFGPREVVEETETGEITMLEDVCKTLDYSRSHLKIGHKIRINFNRD